MTTAWAKADTFDDLVEILLNMAMAHLESQLAKEDDPGWLEQLAANRSKVEDKLRPLMVQDAERIWAGHLRREGRLQ